jgi:hypothetical protein
MNTLKDIATGAGLLIGTMLLLFGPSLACGLAAILFGYPFVGGLVAGLILTGLFALGMGLAALVNLERHRSGDPR